MRYRTEALLIAALFLAAGILILALTATSDTGPIGIPATLLAFIGLGLLLIGSLILFATPDIIVTAHIANRALDPYVANLAKIIATTEPNGVRLHLPSTVLGSNTPVLLVLNADRSSRDKIAKTIARQSGATWDSSLKVLEPVGLGLLATYEQVLGRDFLGVDLEQLSRLLTRALVSELQLGAGFSLRFNSPTMIEADWSKSAIAHTCVGNTAASLAELCCLCSSIACALVKATGKPVLIEASRSSNGGSTITTIFRLEESATR